MNTFNSQLKKTYSMMNERIWKIIEIEGGNNKILLPFIEFICLFII